MSEICKEKAGIKPEVLAAITAAIALCCYSAEQGFQIKEVKKGINPWRKAGIVEMMLGRELNRDFL
ncbi:MAG: hypothetical protein HPY89_08415 [Pelotomaculum sp.]|uniref:Methylmalonyl-CoA decarboxylase, epsilon subunit n=1 Tax=Pelotomaculum thermopropionicum (strain DSM 13744 / JCM 10971 / SI) TaxID=370438 RepID=A5D2J0_PELTS|nr:hypothetical protein [Pelotomaculum sp.]BAF59546.1 methylmalonyl-CoA decarboxylase, epsilon subunit [Pelotomaculum thermopropionicum SI]